MRTSLASGAVVAALLSLGAALVGCAKGGGEPSNSFGSGSGSAASGSGLAPGNSGSSGSTLGGSGSLAQSGGGVLLDPGSPPSGGQDGGHGKRCDDAGNCSCIAVASIGHEGVWGPCSSDTTTAFRDWLNTQSTAKVDNYDTVKPTITADFLAQYDVIVLQWMVANGQKDNDGAPWAFSPDEIDALKTWVQNGGGVIALNGYQCPGNGCTIEDVVATNQLLSFTDIQFNADDNLDLQAPGAPAGGGQFNYCFGGAVPLGGPIDDGGVAAVGTWDQTTPIGEHVTSVGAYVMRSIKTSTATVDCSDSTHAFAVHEQVGKGHVVAYGDEWITYSGEWLGTGACLGDGGTYANPYDPCYQKSPVEVFQIPQLWYNAIKYAASSIECFTISNPTIIPR